MIFLGLGLSNLPIQASSLRSRIPKKPGGFWLCHGQPTWDQWGAFGLTQVGLQSMEVSSNQGTPKSSMLMGFSINHPFRGSFIYGNPHITIFVSGTGNPTTSNWWRLSSRPALPPGSRGCWGRGWWTWAEERRPGRSTELHWDTNSDLYASCFSLDPWLMDMYGRLDIST